MNSITPKAGGINYAKLRKQKSKEDTLPKSCSNTIKFDAIVNLQQQHSILKHRSTSQHNIHSQPMSQIQLFDQYFNQTRTYENSGNFVEFLDKQLQYHQQPTQPIQYIFRTQNKKWDDEKKKLLMELQKYQQENAYLQKENHEMKRSKQGLVKRCEVLQELIVKERLVNQNRGSYMSYKYQDLLKNIQIPMQETVSSLTDERFESNETSLDSSLSNEDDQLSPTQMMDFIKNSKHRYNFSKQIS